MSLSRIKRLIKGESFVGRSKHNATSRGQSVQYGRRTMMLSQSGQMPYRRRSYDIPSQRKIKVGEHWCVRKQTRIWSALSIMIEDPVPTSYNANVFDTLAHPISAEACHKEFKAIVTAGHHPKKMDLT